MAVQIDTIGYTPTSAFIGGHIVPVISADQFWRPPMNADEHR